MTENRLKGIIVIVTRPEHQAGALCRAAKDAGAKVIRFPALSLAPTNKQNIARKKLATLKRGDWVLFVSPNAVLFGMEFMPNGQLPQGVHAAAVGSATAAELKKHGVKKVVTPQSGHDSEALLDTPALKCGQGDRAVIVKAPGGRRLLSRELKHRGAAVESIIVYRRERPRVGLQELAGRLPRRGRIVTTVTSAEVLRNLLHMVDAATRERLQQAPLVVVSGRVKGLAEWLGFEHVTVARGVSAQALVDAVARAVQSR